MDNPDWRTGHNEPQIVPGMVGDERGALSIYFRQLGALPQLTPE